MVSNPLDLLSVDLFGLYTLKGKECTEINFMCVTMIGPAKSWCEIMDLLVTESNLVIFMGKRATRVLTHIINLKKLILINNQHKLAL